MSSSQPQQEDKDTTYPSVESTITIAAWLAPTVIVIVLAIMYGLYYYHYKYIPTSRVSPNNQTLFASVFGFPHKDSYNKALWED
jgi:drug/metabolite transporter (DMT)-like permease